ncbi:carbamate kinase [Bacteroidetes/Chlorobi group bacterium ChocPot_Mid]|jgi:carbamate kinase|nr:MAG: carbamate kinase [Bacteroidetes/Chlorobi group bacterium ChocPot_Mid]
MAQKALIAVGGNSLIRAGERGTLAEQSANARATAKSIARMIKLGWEVVITHGNGPQAGAALLRSERAGNEVYTHTLDMCVATTQSEIGYIMQRELEFELKQLGLKKLVTTIPTMVLVDKNDNAFKNPTKPIGPFYEKNVAEQKRRTLGWDIVEDAARGYRRVVASPEPIEVLQLEVISKSIEMGIVVIALGGGGIPVAYGENGEIVGMEAVIDKDRSSALLAKNLNVDLFVISTDTDQVYLNYKTDRQQGIRKATAEEMQRYLDEGQFPPGSMGPKVESAIKFIKNGGKKVIITSYEYLMDALEEKAGTHISE